MKRFTTYLGLWIVLLAVCGACGSGKSAEFHPQGIDGSTAQSVDKAALATWMTDHEPDAENYLDVPDTVMKQWQTVGSQACRDVGVYLRSVMPAVTPIPDPNLDARFHAAVEQLTADVEACGATDATRADAAKLRGDADKINKVLVDTLIASKS